MFRVHMFPAAHGDALLIEYGQADSFHSIWIDGGPCKDDKNRELKDKAWLAMQDYMINAKTQFELSVVSHVDADHIDGMVALLNNASQPFQPVDFWFNGWHHLLNDRLGPIEGEFLSTLISERKLSWNGAFGGRAIVCRPNETLPAKPLPDGMKLTLLSPTLKALEALIPRWQADVQKVGLTPGQPVSRTHKAWRDRLGGNLDIEELASKPFHNDSTPSNGSSIAFLAEYKGVSCLFAADAHSSVLESSIDALLTERGLEKLPVHVFKLPHHGSAYNLSPGLLQRIDCRNYLISTNGESRSHHPNEITLARILQKSKQQADAAFENGRDYQKPIIHFNYRCSQTEVWEDEGLKRRYAYETSFPPAQESGLIVDCVI